MSLLGEQGLEITKQREKDYSVIRALIRSQLDKEGFNIGEEWWPDGYLVTNDHNMWHFELKECPNWLFGVWLDDGVKYGTEYDNEYLIRVFAQHKGYINKFKPSDCLVAEEYSIEEEDVQNGDIAEYNTKRWTELFRYVRDNPGLAWYRNARYVDYNVEYVSPEKAKEVFEKAEKERLEYELAQEKQHQEEYDYIKGILDKRGVKYKILDSKPYAIPRYEVIIEDPTVDGVTYAKIYTKEETLGLREIQDRYRGLVGFGDGVWLKKHLEVENEN